DEDNIRPWFLVTMQRAQIFDLLQHGVLILNRSADALLTPVIRLSRQRRQRQRAEPAISTTLFERAFDFALLIATIASVALMLHFILGTVDAREIGWTFVLGAFTAARVLILIAVASLIWVPIGVWIGLRPRIADRAQPIVQFLAAFPANLFFPAAVVLILKFSLNPEIWLSPLMILGTQWYILFNVIGGTLSLPPELKLAASNLGVRRWLWWRRVMLPAIFPAYVTGAVTAAGGSWNASIVSEVVQWGDTTLTATGLGAYIAQYTASGDAARITLGIGVLCLFVLAFNRLLWRRLYNLAAERLRMD
ncbi:MAG TPA: ABC transporter permease subunit, partial [Stellaceae bacterium]|nr:ABC transporter permease subunit [Stellaceae bacterium]